MLYESIVKPVLNVLSRKDPEIAHDIAIGALKMINNQSVLLSIIRELATPTTNEHLVQDILGISFPNPIGLAAGFDKNIVVPQAISAFGFGFIEVGTVTRFAQSGNPRPRIVRFPRHNALVNAMGFPNHGESLIRIRLQKKPVLLSVPLGVSIGKSKCVPMERAVEEYCHLLRSFYDIGDYTVVNISSPNTLGLRALQAKEYFDELVRSLIAERESILREYNMPQKPIFVKISPDVSWEERDDILEICCNRGVDGLIAVNTTLDHRMLGTRVLCPGGLSGTPLLHKSLSMVRYVRTHMPKDFVIIGVGGVRTIEDAYHMFSVGADLVQILTASFDEGPFLPRRLARGVYKYMKRDGIKNISELKERGLKRCLR